ncbi:methionine ABC transporter ATP-binding protein [Olivibacter sitiensis]|uniref:methionine ABC transporter ATP-binding protein n=1 Tax=Olivibacter sitiensis TaxID=376470 RepID=UPI0003F64731|nr:ATP-binding cassette domain-containing protein [Olivibacter sitiensis]
MITIKNVSKTFYQKDKAFKALDNINLTVAEADIVGVIGSSGAGKSTLIRCVNLLEKPEEGQIIVNGTELTRLTEKQLAQERKKIGMIFQHFNLLSSRAVFNNVALPLELDGVPKAEIRRKVTELLEVVGLREKANDYPKNLSGGQKQRVAIARALANDPYVLLCDEATSALDPATTQSILQLLKDINKRLHLTILLITHEMEVVKSICNHVAVIDRGKLVAKGTIRQLLAKDDKHIIHQFIQSDAMTLPKELSENLQKDYQEGLCPIIEIQLNGNMRFDVLIAKISGEYQVPFKVLRADIEYLGDTNFGKLLLHLMGSTEENARAIYYFNQHQLKNTIKGYA